MKVILLIDVPKLGQKSEVKNVSAGYARNYLFPRKLAAAVSSAALLELEFQNEINRKAAEKELVQTEALAQKIDGLEIEMLLKVSKEGVGYAAISAQRIAEALQGLGYKISKNQVKIKTPIKKLGEHNAAIVLPHGLEAEIKIIVVAEAEGEDE